MNLHIHNIKFASTGNSGSPFLGSELQFFILIFPNVRPEFQTSGRNLERSARISNVRPESRTFGRNFERSAGIFFGKSQKFCLTFFCRLFIIFDIFDSGILNFPWQFYPPPPPPPGITILALAGALRAWLWFHHPSHTFATFLDLASGQWPPCGFRTKQLSL